MKKNKARKEDRECCGGAQGKNTILNGVVKESFTHWSRNLKEVRELAMQINIWGRANEAEAVINKRS